jgi:hypothetical protein
MYVRFTELTKAKKSENMVLGVELVIEAYPVVKFKMWNQGVKVKQQICSTLQGQDWLKQSDFFGLRSAALIQSLQPLKVEKIMK